jgi:hypothetical protein
MGTIAEQIHHNGVHERRSKWLGSNDSLMSIAEISIPFNQYLIINQIGSFIKWQDQFSGEYRDLWDNVLSNREGNWEKWLEYLRGSQEAPQSVSSAKLLGNFRNKDVLDRWKFEKLFADNIDTPRGDILGVLDADGADGTVFRSYNPNEFYELVSYGKVSGIEGHHINAVQSILDNPNDKEAFLRTFSPDNIRLATDEGHDAIHRAAGGFGEPTSGYAREVGDKYDRIIDSKKGQAFDNDGMMATSIAIGILAGSISAIIKYRQLKDSNSPWAHKVALEFLSSGLGTGITSLIAMQAGNLVAEELLNESVAIASYIGMDASAAVVNSLIDSAASFAVFDIVRLGKSSISQLSKGVNADTLSTIGNNAICMAGEQLGFFLLGLALDSIVPIPDPVVGPMVSVFRISYRVGKTVVNLEKEKASQKACRDVRMKIGYDRAIVSLQATSSG